MNTKIYFTRKGYENARARIDNLEARLRELQAGVGDAAETGGNQWHDNAAYEQLVIDIRGVDALLRAEHEALNNAEIIDPHKSSTTVSVGSTVTLRFENGDVEKFEIAGHGESDAEQSIIAYNTPLALILLGGTQGSVRRGKIGPKIREVTIISIERLGEK